MPEQPAIAQAAPPAAFGSWAIRRRIVILTLLFCAVCESYLTFLAADNVLHQQLAYALAGVAVLVINGYVFGSVADDHSIRQYLAHTTDSSP